MDINTTITQLVNTEINKLGIPVATLARNTGLSTSTLERRTKGGGAWTATEIASVARGLRIPCGKLLPPEFAQVDVAA